MSRPFFSIGCRAVLMALLAGAPSSLFAQSPVPVVSMLDSSTLQQVIHERHGRVLLVNVWATWCAPCVEEFPDLVRLDSVYRSRGVDVVTISIDFEDEVENKIKPFLRRMKATMPAYVNACPTASDLINAIDPTWSGAIPATFVYDRSGRRVDIAVGRQSFEAFRSMIERAVKHPGTTKNRR